MQVPISSRRGTAPAVDLLAERLRTNKVTRATLGNSTLHAISLRAAQQLAPLLFSCTSLTVLCIHLAHTPSPQALQVLLAGAAGCASLQTVIITGGLSLAQGNALADGMAAFIQTKKTATPAAVSGPRTPQRTPPLTASPHVLLQAKQLRGRQKQAPSEEEHQWKVRSGSRPHAAALPFRFARGGVEWRWSPTTCIQEPLRPPRTPTPRMVCCGRESKACVPSATRRMFEMGSLGVRFVLELHEPLLDATVAALVTGVARSKRIAQVEVRGPHPPLQQGNNCGGGGGFHKSRLATQLLAAKLRPFLRHNRERMAAAAAAPVTSTACQHTPYSSRSNGRTPPPLLSRRGELPRQSHQVHCTPPISPRLHNNHRYLRAQQEGRMESPYVYPNARPPLDRVPPRSPRFSTGVAKHHRGEAEGISALPIADALERLHAQHRQRHNRPGLSSSPSSRTAHTPEGFRYPVRGHSSAEHCFFATPPLHRYSPAQLRRDPDTARQLKIKQEDNANWTQSVLKHRAGVEGFSSHRCRSLSSMRTVLSAYHCDSDSCTPSPSPRCPHHQRGSSGRNPPLVYVAPSPHGPLRSGVAPKQQQRETHFGIEKLQHPLPSSPSHYQMTEKNPARKTEDATEGDSCQGCPTTPTSSPVSITLPPSTASRLGTETLPTSSRSPLTEVTQSSSLPLFSPLRKASQLRHNEGLEAEQQQQYQEKRKKKKPVTPPKLSVRGTCEDMQRRRAGLQCDRATLDAILFAAVNTAQKLNLSEFKTESPQQQSDGKAISARGTEQRASLSSPALRGGVTARSNRGTRKSDCSTSSNSANGITPVRRRGYERSSSSPETQSPRAAPNSARAVMMAGMTECSSKAAPSQHASDISSIAMCGTNPSRLLPSPKQHSPALSLFSDGATETGSSVPFSVTFTPPSSPPHQHQRPEKLEATRCRTRTSSPRHFTSTKSPGRVPAGCCVGGAAVPSVHTERQQPVEQIKRHIEAINEALVWHQVQTDVKATEIVKQVEGLNSELADKVMTLLSGIMVMLSEVEN